MSIENSKVIDFVSIDPNKNVVLTISDHLGWDDNEHLFLLQEKINHYLAAIESGELYKVYPQGIGKRVIINISMKYEPSELGIVFLRRVEELLKENSYALKTTLLNK